MELQCGLCSKTIPGFLKGLKLHFVNDHNLLFQNSNCYYNFSCGQNCSDQFSSFITLGRHIIKKHSLNEHTANENLDNEDFNFYDEGGVEDLSSDVIIIDECLDECLDDNVKDLRSFQDLEYSINNIICELRTHTNLAESTLEYVVSSIMDISQNIIQYLKNKIEASEDENVSTILNNLDICKLFTSCSTFVKQKKYIAKKLSVTESREITLGTRVENVIKGSEHTVKTIRETFEYIPIIDTLETIIKNKNLRDVIENEVENDNPHLYESFRDSTSFKNSPFFQAYPNAIRINFYYDDIELCNPIGSRSTFHKLGMFYFTIQNFPLQMNSSLNNIYTVAICYKSDIKKYGFAAILRPLVEDLKKLESDEGITVYIDESVTYTVRAALVSFTGDTLAAHEILGHQGPSCKYFCRICYISRLQLHIDEPGIEYEFRNKIAHEEQVKKVLEDPRKSKLFGVNADTELNKLENFNSTENTIFDPMHDLLEGIIPLEIKNVLKYYIFEKKLFDVEFLNQRIHSFRYGCIEICNKPSANFTTSNSIFNWSQNS